MICLPIATENTCTDRVTIVDCVSQASKPLIIKNKQNIPKSQAANLYYYGSVNVFVIFDCKAGKREKKLARRRRRLSEKVLAYVY